MIYSKSHSLVNLANSMLKYFDQPCFHDSIPEIDDILNRSGRKKVALVLMDGLNEYIKSIHLDENDFLRKNAVLTIDSVFPPTTVAATTAIQTAKYPIESGWLGWSQHFKDLGITIDMFLNRISKTDQKCDHEISYEDYPYETIAQIIDRKYRGTYVAPDHVKYGSAADLDDFYKQIDELLDQDEKQFIYAYWDQPDGLMHKYGVRADEVHEYIQMVNRRSEEMVKKHPDTLFLIIADHGLVDCEFIYFNENKELYDTLKYMPYLDSRSLFVDIKDEYKDKFREMFYASYSRDDFDVLSKEEYLEQNYFGLGTPYPNIDNFLGDFLIVSKTEKMFVFKGYDGNYFRLVANHAGGMEEEFKISVVIANN